jgi:Fur family ferric uptake transcriptional regulator
MRGTVEQEGADDTLGLVLGVLARLARAQETGMETQDLRKAGLKVTHPRLRILEILETSPGKHFSAEDIYRRLIDHHDDIGLATVYRVLTQFETAGLVLKHNFEGGQAVYEIDRGKHHDHMVDVDTGKVIEFTSEEIEELQHAIAEKHGYQIEDHSLVLYVRAKKKK